ncbi:hypothetical protein NDU88_010575 [Pleurodeles waltl]|uniref:Uncharacterized protein n=1 Tax=Pleurodeles waltl TaxID=8319 RepID=A0AAV7PYG2_PLEWA|nr:hypothetical protein NDU88_010575 [Pleurodeles waltl]
MPRDPPYRHPDLGGPTAGIWMAVGGVGIPAAVQQAAPPRRIQWGRGTLAGPRQWCRSARQSPAVRLPFRGRKTAAVILTFPLGWRGGRLQTASQPSGKEASTMKPARNRAGGVEAVRRVQLHPSRISLSAQQTVKYM